MSYRSAFAGASRAIIPVLAQHLPVLWPCVQWRAGCMGCAYGTRCMCGCSFLQKRKTASDNTSLAGRMRCGLGFVGFADSRWGASPADNSRQYDYRNHVGEHLHELRWQGEIEPLDFDL